MRPLRVLMLQAQPYESAKIGFAVSPPLGLLHLASYARQALKNSQIHFRLVDTYFHSDEYVSNEVLAFRPDVVGISGITLAHERIKALCSILSDLAPQQKIILGGPHTTSFPEVCLGYPGVHAIVRGEGEVAFTDYLEYVAGTRRLEEVRGILYRKNGEICANPAAPPILDMDSLPFPAFDLVELDRYFLSNNDLNVLMPAPHRYINLFSSRGCPYKCYFCHKMFGNRLRAMSIPRLLEHLRRVVEDLGVRNIRFMDDLFNCSRKRLLDFCEAVVRANLGVRIHFCTGLRADLLDEEQVQAMAEAGVVYLGVAIESASPRLQREMRKNLDVVKALEAAVHADKAGIFTTGFFMFGFPGETREEMELTIRVAESSAFHFAYFSLLQPYQGTGVSKIRGPWFTNLEDFEEGFSGTKNCAGIPEEEMIAIVREAFRRFWTPRRFMAFLARHPNLGEFVRGLTVPRSLGHVARRVASVLHIYASKNATTSEDWEAPFTPPPALQNTAFLFGRFVSRVANMLYKSPEPLDEALLKRVSRQHVAEPCNSAPKKSAPTMDQS